MIRRLFVCLLVFNMVAAIGTELLAQTATLEMSARQAFWTYFWTSGLPRQWSQV